MLFEFVHHIALKRVGSQDKGWVYKKAGVATRSKGTTPRKDVMLILPVSTLTEFITDWEVQTQKSAAPKPILLKHIDQRGIIALVTDSLKPILISSVFFYFIRKSSNGILKVKKFLSKIET